MARFCSQCGRPLADGEVCTCTQGNGTEANNAGYTQPNNAGYTQPNNAGANGYTQPNNAGANGYTQPNNAGYTQGNGAPNNDGAAAKEAAKEAARYAADSGAKYAKNVFAKIGPTFKDPIGEIKRMARANKLEEPMVLVITNILAVFVMSIILMLVLRLKLGDYAQWIQIPYVKTVLSLTFLAAAVDFINAGLMILSAKVFFREETSFARILSVIGGSLFPLTIAFVVGIVLMFISIWLGFIVIAAGCLYSTTVQIMGYYEVSLLSTAKKMYSYLVYLVLNGICQSLFVGLMVASVLSSFVNWLEYLL